MRRISFPSRARSWTASSSASSWCSSAALTSAHPLCERRLGELRGGALELLGEVARGQVRPHAVVRVDRAERRFLLAAADPSLRQQAARLARATPRPLDTAPR